MITAICATMPLFIVASLAFAGILEFVIGKRRLRKSQERFEREIEEERKLWQKKMDNN